MVFLKSFSKKPNSKTLVNNLYQFYYKINVILDSLYLIFNVIFNV